MIRHRFTLYYAYQYFMMFQTSECTMNINLLLPTLLDKRHQKIYYTNASIFFIWLLSISWWYEKICWKTKSTKKMGKSIKNSISLLWNFTLKLAHFCWQWKKKRERAQNSQKPSIVWMIKFSLHFEQFFLFSFSIKKSPPKTHSEIRVKSKFIIVNGVKNL